MADIAFQTPVNSASDAGLAESTEKPNGVSGLEQVCKAMGMDPHPKNELERPDINFLQV